MVKMDPTQVDQILLNLAANARDAISGVGRISIRTENFTATAAHGDPVGLAPGEYIRLTVQDDGAGMEPHVLEHAFEPFYTTKGVGHGTGLGLAVVYGIVQQNDGFIDVSSIAGRGATFRLYLRRAVPPAAAAIPATTESTSEGTPEAAGRTVLLVEDEPSILRLGTLMLKKFGYTVLAAESPAEAVRIARSHAGAIDLLMTDVVMPTMDGRQLARELTGIRPGLRCLFMSGYTADVIAHRGILFEGVQHLQKPFSSKDLAAKLHDVFAAPAAGVP
jgi:CheY-like chemotaxis protein